MGEPVAPFLEGPNGEVTLNGVKCQACGHVAYPFQDYGCEKCGAFGEDLVLKPMAARGTLASFVDVHFYFGKDIEPPFYVGLIALEDGPIVRCTLATPGREPLTHGVSMSAKVYVNDAPDPQNPVREVRFESGA
jgi:uncharacterized OB-fold protein